MIKYLIENGFNPNIPIKDRNVSVLKTTLLIKWGIEKQDLELTQLLLAKGATISISNTSSAISSALRYLSKDNPNSGPILKCILESVKAKGTKFLYFDSIYASLVESILKLMDESELTKEKKESIVNILLYDNELKEHFGCNTTLDFFLNEDIRYIFTNRLLKILMEERENRTSLINQINLNSTDYDGYNIIQYSIIRNNDLIEILFQYEDTKFFLLNSLRGKVKEFNLIHWAVSNKRAEFLKLMLNDEDSRNIFLSPSSLRDRRDNSPLDLAIKASNSEIVEIFLGNIDAMKILLSPKNIKGEYMGTPLQLAIKMKNDQASDKIIMLLLENKYTREILLSQLSYTCV